MRSVVLFAFCLILGSQFVMATGNLTQNAHPEDCDYASHSPDAIEVTTRNFNICSDPHFLTHATCSKQTQVTEEEESSGAINF